MNMPRKFYSRDTKDLNVAKVREFFDKKLEVIPERLGLQRLTDSHDQSQIVIYLRIELVELETQYRYGQSIKLVPSLEGEPDPTVFDFRL